MTNKPLIANKNKISQTLATPDFNKKGTRFRNVLVGLCPNSPFVFLVSRGKNKHIIQYAKLVSSLKSKHQ